MPTKRAQFLFYSIFIIFLFLKYSLGFSNSPDRLRTRYNVMLEEVAPTCRSPLIILLLSAACSLRLLACFSPYIVTVPSQAASLIPFLCFLFQVNVGTKIVSVYIQETMGTFESQPLYMERK